MVKKEMVAARLEKLRSYLQVLQQVQQYDLERFKRDPFIHGTAERYLHLAIECLLDIGNHLIADRRLRKPQTYGEVFEVLAEAGVIPAELQKELAGMAAFRNVLVHDYLELDRERVYGLLREKLDILEGLARIYGELL